MAGLEQEVREFRAEFNEFRGEVATEFARVRSELDRRCAKVDQRMAAGFEEVNRHMRVLHEDLLGRIALTQEAGSRPRRKRRDTK